MTLRPVALVATGVIAGLLLIEPARLSQAVAQVLPALQDERFAGLQWHRLETSARRRRVGAGISWRRSLASAKEFFQLC